MIMRLSKKACFEICAHHANGLSKEELKEFKIMAFRCKRCKKLKCGYCEGAADEFPDSCDDCWLATTKSQTA
jgi:hypothetical protein